MRRNPKASKDEDELDEYERLDNRIEFMAVICKVSGVPVSQYEAWVDSMSPEYFARYCDKIMSEDVTKILMR